jgi:hypothetical protein
MERRAKYLGLYVASEDAKAIGQGKDHQESMKAETPVILRPDESIPENPVP